MSGTLQVGVEKRIRDCGKDEAWLQEQIANSPEILGLGELMLLEREKRQTPGGRLDILLKDTEDDSMYEVEVMLGETDESHIIRTIEYWDWHRKDNYHDGVRISFTSDPSHATHHANDIATLCRLGKQSVAAGKCEVVA